MNHYRNMITKPEIQFWIPILINVVALTIAIMSIKSDIRSLAERMDRLDKVTATVNELHRDITTLKTIHSLME